MTLMEVSVAGGTIRQDSAGKSQLEIDVLFDFLEARIARRAVDHRVHFGGFLAGEISGCVQCIDADVHERSASGKLLVQSPHGGIAHFEAGVCETHLRRPEISGWSDANPFWIV